MKKRKNKDCELINECVETLLMLKGNDLDEIEKKTEILKYQSLDKILNDTARSTKFNIFRKKYIATTITVISLLILSQFVAMAFDYNPVVEMYKYITSNLSLGNTITEDNVTYTYHGYAKTYNSIDELIQQEHLDILYPIQLPDDINITNVITNDIEGYNQINIVFNTDDLLYMINKNYLINMKDIKNYDKYEIQDIEIYIITQNQEYEAIFYYNDYEYHIVSTDYELIIKIINNLNIYE